MDTLIIILMILSPKDTATIKQNIVIEKPRAASNKAARRIDKAYYAKLEELYQQPKMR